MARTDGTDDADMTMTSPNMLSTTTMAASNQNEPVEMPGTEKRPPTRMLPAARSPAPARPRRAARKVPAQTQASTAQKATVRSPRPRSRPSPASQARPAVVTARGSSGPTRETAALVYQNVREIQAPVVASMALRSIR